MGKLTWCTNAGIGCGGGNGGGGERGGVQGGSTGQAGSACGDPRVLPWGPLPLGTRDGAWCWGRTQAGTGSDRAGGGREPTAVVRAGAGRGEPAHQLGRGG